VGLLLLVRDTPKFFGTNSNKCSAEKIFEKILKKVLTSQNPSAIIITVRGARTEAIRPHEPIGEARSPFKRVLPPRPPLSLVLCFGFDFILVSFPPS
jgi:hypothetical protein